MSLCRCATYQVFNFHGPVADSGWWFCGSGERNSAQIYSTRLHNRGFSLTRPDTGKPDIGKRHVLLVRCQSGSDDIECRSISLMVNNNPAGIERDWPKVYYERIKGECAVSGFTSNHADRLARCYSSLCTQNRSATTGVGRVSSVG